jgi:hypothetical protein
VIRLNTNAIIFDELPRIARIFIKRVISIMEKYIPNTSYAVFLFGSLSHARDKANCVDGTSDVDLLIIVNDDVASEARKAWPELNALQQLLANNVTKRHGIIPSILRVIERQTGMHESIFLSRERDFKNVRFSSIFKTNKILSWLLAPANIVFGSALCHMKRVHGNEDIEVAVRSMQSTIGHEKHVLPDLVRSLLMNVVLAMGAVLLLPVTRRATIYSIEATKWSMYAATYLMIGERPSKPGQKRFFSKLGVNATFLDRWMKLSQHYEPDVKFTLATLWNVLKIHALGFKIKKIR